MYSVRVGFTPLLVFGSGLMLGLAAVFTLMATDPEVTTETTPRIILLTVVAAFGALGTSFVVGALRRPLALRVDHAGVTLGRPPWLFTHQGLWWKGRETTVPWEHIAGIVTFTLPVPGSGSQDFVGVCLRPGVPLPEGEPDSGGGWRRMAVLLGQDAPAGDIGPYRQILGWRVDEKRLKQAVRHHARGVRVVSR